MTTPFADLNAYRRELVAFDGAPPAVVKTCTHEALAWLAVLPGLRLEVSPCWRAACPLCGAPGELWVSVGVDEGWTCFACKREGPDPASLRAAMEAPR